MGIKYLLVLLFCLIVSGRGYAIDNLKITKVYLVFKTHLDVGFTDLSSRVTESYVKNFIPKALEVSEKLKADNSGERYVWTTGAWLVWKFRQVASQAEVERLDAAIRRGDIVYNGVPYTVETESMNVDLLEGCLEVIRRLDRMYGKQTIAAKMTDVPGHTRSIIAPLNRFGIRFLHVGVNPASAIPDVPGFCRWQDSQGNELLLVYQKDYGSESVLPDGKQVISINFTGDNLGPHTYEDVKRIYAQLRKKYPNAQLEAVSFNEIARELQTMKALLPIVTSEIADTWIYGMGSAPIRMAKFRALSTLYSKWLKEGRLDQENDASLNFALELGLIAEHTQGMDIKTHLGNWDKYDMDEFLLARHSEPFQKVEQSWKELDGYLYSSISYLPQPLQEEALAKLEEIDNVKVPVFSKKAKEVTPKPWNTALLKKKLKLRGLFYQQYNQNDYANYMNNYLRSQVWWSLADFGKPGLDKSGAVSATLQAEVVKQDVKKEKGGVRTTCELAFRYQSDVDARVYPEKIYVSYLALDNQKKAEVEVTIVNKPSVRLPEAYWFAFDTDELVSSIVAEKMGQSIDLFDVVKRGNRQMHGIDRYVDLQMDSGTIRIWSETALLVNVGEMRGINYSTQYPDKQGGIYFNLSNNLWGTNYNMWNEGSLTYRFKVESL